MEDYAAASPPALEFLPARINTARWLQALAASSSSSPSLSASPADDQPASSSSSGSSAAELDLSSKLHLLLLAPLAAQMLRIPAGGEVGGGAGAGADEENFKEAAHAVLRFAHSTIYIHTVHTTATTAHCLDAAA